MGFIIIIIIIIIICVCGKNNSVFKIIFTKQVLKVWII